MRLMRGDQVRLLQEGEPLLMTIRGLSVNGNITLAEPHEANVDARSRSADSGFRYTYKRVGSLQSAKAAKATISPIGDLRVHRSR